MKFVFSAFCALILLGACTTDVGSSDQLALPYSPQTYAAPGYAGTYAPAVATPTSAPIALTSQAYPSATPIALRSITADRYLGWSLWDTEGGFEKQIARKAKRACDNRPYREFQRIPGQRFRSYGTGTVSIYQKYTITLQCL
ncbi:hypothetical protein [Thioclava sp. GXIMD4216]|uniref:hypothetical protein n=1 Tax=Thioclava sp. GXIMD4216 TaxID=3131929 RepID=UPI0030CFCC72